MPSLPNRAELCLLALVLALGSAWTPSFGQQALPDLVIAKIWIGDRNNTPINPKANEPFYVCATVKNLGSAHAEGYYVQPYFGGSPLATGGPGKLEAGGAQDWSSGPVSVGPGIYEVRWLLNPDRRVPEANYGNNEISMIIVIEAGSPFEVLLQPIGGFVGLAAIVLTILAVGLALRKYVERRKRIQAASEEVPKTRGRRP